MTTPTASTASADDGRQAENLRRFAADLGSSAPPTADRVAVVFGGKGGVGTSAITLAIARDLARSSSQGPGISVLAVDANGSRNDLALMAADEPTNGLALTTSRKLGVEPPAGEGASVVEAAKRLLRAGRLWTNDAGGWIVIDAGAGDTLWARELASRAIRPLLVTTPDRLATVNSYLALKRIGAASSRVGVIVNHSPDASVAAEIHESFARSCERFLATTPTLAGWLPTQSDNPAEGVVLAAA